MEIFVVHFNEFDNEKMICSWVSQCYFESHEQAEQWILNQNTRDEVTFKKEDSYFIKQNYVAEIGNGGVIRACIDRLFGLIERG